MVVIKSSRIFFVVWCVLMVYFCIIVVSGCIKVRVIFMIVR